MEHLVEDRREDHVLESRFLSVKYDEWYLGTITWYNERLAKYRVVFHDGTEDYIGMEEIDGENIVLI